MQTEAQTVSDGGKLCPGTCSPRMYNVVRRGFLRPGMVPGEKPSKVLRVGRGWLFIVAKSFGWMLIQAGLWM